jgi:hypothetical protein
MEAVNRFYIFLIPLIAVLCSYAMIKVHIRSITVGKLLLLVVILALSADFIYGLPPALLFNDLYYVDPPLASFNSAGKWLDTYDTSDEYLVSAPYVHVVDFFAQKSRTNVFRIDLKLIEGGTRFPGGLPLLIGNLYDPYVSVSRSFSKPERIDAKIIEDRFGKIYVNGVISYLR